MAENLLATLVGESQARLACPPPPAEVGPKRSFRQALAAPGVRIIAEVKRRSPSAGVLRDPLEPASLAASYARGGAAAISVVTEPRFFGGEAAWVSQVKRACPLPVLQKDFFSRPEQVAYAAACGADALLLIARVLAGSLLGEMLQACQEAGLEALVETHSPEEIHQALAAGAPVVGVNARDLATFAVDVPRAAQLIRLIPPPTLAVLESGIGSRQQLGQLVEAGVRCFLVGEYLLRQEDPERSLRELREGPWSP